MSQERKKVMIYLRPEAYANEKAASEKIKKHSDMARTALLAGLALGEVDSRLPGLLAVYIIEELFIGEVCIFWSVCSAFVFN